MINTLSADRFLKNQRLLVALFCLAIIYLVLNTGIVSDDFNAMALTKGKSFVEVLVPRGDFYFVDTPVEHFSQYIWYRFFDLSNAVAVNICKIVYIMLSFLMVAQFFKIYVRDSAAFLISFFFIFFPSHDSTVYMFMTQYLTLSFAFYLYAYYLAYRNQMLLAFVSATIASFISYGSTPIALALFVLFVLNKSVKKAMIMLIPNILYALYFISVTVIREMGHPRVLEAISVSAVIKQYLLQIVTFVDAMFGPSMWLKVYYALSQLSLVSVVVGVFLIVVVYQVMDRFHERFDSKLMVSLVVLLVIVVFDVRCYRPLSAALFQSRQ